MGNFKTQYRSGTSERTNEGLAKESSEGNMERECTKTKAIQIHLCMQEQLLEGRGQGLEGEQVLACGRVCREERRNPD